MTVLDPVAGPYDLGEGPLWDELRQRLLVVDIMAGHVHEIDPVTWASRRLDVGMPVGAVACTTRGDWVIAAAQGFYRLDPETGHLTHIAEAAPGRDDLRMNDGYVDPWGRFWAGTLSLRRERARAALYRLDPDGSVRTVLEGVTTSNGLDWSPDRRTMYFVDTETGRVDCFEIDPASGEVSGRRPFVTVPPDEGRPDGLIVDADEGVWVALWRGGAICRFLPDGRLDRRVRLPVALVTKCAFGGADLRQCFVTTARRGLSANELEAQPLAGRVFSGRLGNVGQRPRRFAG